MTSLVTDGCEWLHNMCILVASSAVECTNKYRYVPQNRLLRATLESSRPEFALRLTGSLYARKLQL